jgi:hypothetical protein
MDEKRRGCEDKRRRHRPGRWLEESAWGKKRTEKVRGGHQMRLLPLFLSFIIIGLIICPFLSLAQIIPNGPTPSETVKAAGKITVTPIDLRSSSFAVFGAPAFEDEEIKSGHYNSGIMSVDYNTSEKENPGIPTSLNNWSMRVESLTLRVDDNITDVETNYHTAPSVTNAGAFTPPVLEMTPTE